MNRESGPSLSSETNRFSVNGRAERPPCWDAAATMRTRTSFDPSDPQPAIASRCRAVAHREWNDLGGAPSPWRALPPRRTVPQHTLSSAVGCHFPRLKRAVIDADVVDAAFEVVAEDLVAADRQRAFGGGQRWRGLDRLEGAVDV